MPNVKIAATIEVTFEVTNLAAAKAAITRLPGEVRNPIELSSIGARRSEIVPDTVQVKVVNQTIDGKPI